MGKTRGRLLAETSSRELSQWIAYERLHPLPDTWQQTGILAALINNVLSAGPKRKPGDFIPRVTRGVAREQSPEEAMAHMQALTASMRAGRT